MKHLGNTKSVVAILGTGVTAGATVTANIDRLGHDYLSLDCIMGTADVVSNSPSVLKLGHSDTTDATNFSDITKFVGGGAGGFVIANALTNAPNDYRFDVDAKGLKRYLRLTVSPRTTQAVVLAARLGDAATSADASAATAGVTQLVKG